MSSRTRGVFYTLLLAGFAAAGLSTSAYSFTLTDNYYGGGDTFVSGGSDVIEDAGVHTFEISSAVITRSGTNNDTLNIKIYTNYAGAPGTSAADGTSYGSLFLSPGFWNPTGSAANHYSTDTFASDTQRWKYAVTTPLTGAVGSSTSTGLYAIGTVGAATDYHGTPQYYTSANGKVVMSNVNNDPITAPYSNNPGDYFREGQAVQYDPNSLANMLSAATFSVGTGYVDYSIVDDGLLGDTFYLSWAMTCANDIIQGQVLLTGNSLTGTTPLPGALPMFSAGLGAMGMLSWRKKRKKAKNVAAA